MAIYELKEDQIVEVPDTTFGDEGVKERGDLQRILRDQIEVVSPDTLIVAEEYGEWEGSRRRIDLLGLDRDGNLVVIELKRTDDGGHMELQALRYAAMVSTMTFEQAVEARAKFQERRGIEGDAEQQLLEFLDWSEPKEDQFAQDVRIVLVSADFSKELTTTVIWINSRDMDIRCVRLKPHLLDGCLLMDVQQVLPLREAEDFMGRTKEKTQKERIAREGTMDYTKFDVAVNGEGRHYQGKGRAILFVFKQLIETGVPPERFSAVIDRRQDVTWRCVKGSVDAADFIDRATRVARAEDKTFEAGRWFVKDDELIHVNGRTYCFSTQWGGSTWHEAMKLLVESFPEHKITFEPSGASS